MAVQPPRSSTEQPGAPALLVRRFCLGVGIALLGLATVLVGGATVARSGIASAGPDGDAPADESRGFEPAAYQATWTAHHQPAVNPALRPGCGLDVGLLIDRSGSIANAGAELQVHDAAKVFTDGLAGTPSRVGVWSFGTFSASSPGDLTYPAIGLTDVGGNQAGPGATAVKALIDTIPTGGNDATNWDVAFKAVHATSMASGQPPDVLVVLTDGQPTVFGAAETLPDPRTEDADIDAGIASANLVKGDGTRIFAVGIGAAVDAAALSLISGGTAWDRSNFEVADYALTDFGQLATTLRAAVSELCGGTVTVQKLVRDGLGGEQPEAGWAFTLDAADDPTRATTLETDDDGLTQFDLSGTEPERVAVREEERPDVTLVVDEITCANAAGPAPVLQRDPTGVTFDLGPTDVVACTFPNLRPEVEPATTTTSIPPTTTTSSTTIPPDTTVPTTVPPSTTAPPTTLSPPPTTVSVPTSVDGPAESTTVPGSTEEPTPTAGTLPRTGADTGRLVVAGFSLLGGGGLLTLGLRRRPAGTP